MTEHGNSYGIKSMLEQGWTMDEVCATPFIDIEITQRKTKGAIKQRPVFLWRKDKGEERLGWYSGPKELLTKRMQKEDWLEVDYMGLGEGWIVTIENGNKKVRYHGSGKNIEDMAEGAIPDFKKMFDARCQKLTPEKRDELEVVDPTFFKRCEAYLDSFKRENAEWLNKTR